MFVKNDTSSNKEADYQMMLLQLEALLEDEEDHIANLSNASALLNTYLDEINWVGFYVVKNGMLVLGPFQGLPACNRIEIGKGVCGSTAKNKKTICVENVHDFPGHIACDANSNSEIVVPLFKNNEVIGVLDIDSPKIGRFDQMDQIYLEKAALIIEKYCF